ncbi:glycosyltransferase [Pseudooceanicola sp. LIPI14-2-Ac024]|uniref:glycosyltransferase n=1 Tax=Pseudooceanicola sp. LIPI14-2-Ac024 TaxID=3344875 RepID=UPI0035D0D0F8
MKKNAIVFTANTMHVAQANLMIESLFDQYGGNFRGDLWVISTHLSKRCQAFLDSRGIKYLINPLVEVQDWPYREEIAASQPEYQNGKLTLDDAFLLYRNKRMSKLIVCDWVRKFGDQYESMALCDNDLYFQRDVNELFEKTYADPGVLWYWHEENKMLPGTNLWKKNFNYSRHHDASEIDFGEHEINIGFVIAKPRLMASVFSEVRALFDSVALPLFAEHLWHDQDLVRLIRGKFPEKFRLFDEGDVLHLCNGGKELIEERVPQQFFHKKTNEKPCVVHFAGGVWKGFPSVAASFNVHDGSYFFVEELRPEYDGVRELTDYDPFDVESVFYSEHNVATRNKARAAWIDRRKDSDRKSMMFLSWLETGSHVPQKTMLGDFLDKTAFDMVVIDGNVRARDHDDLLTEDLPDLLANVTHTVRNVEFARQFGYVREDVPEPAIAAAMAALIEEYACTERAARAVSNAAYLYLRRALAFYAPDIVVSWGTYLLCPRILRHLCAEFGIPTVTMELGVLPKTLAFDCEGHMGESWVCEHSQTFNGQPLDDTDTARAARYLADVVATRPSRNLKLAVSEQTQRRMTRLANSGKKTILLMGSNAAFSGYVPYDETGKRFHSPLYDSNDAALRHLSEVFGAADDVQIVYKPHPITMTRGMDVREDYPNVTILRDANLDDCIEFADVALTLVSQGCYESLLRETPVVMLGRNQINGSGAVDVLDAQSNLEATVRQALSDGYTAEKKAKFEAHVARLLKYYLYSTHGETGAREQSRLKRDLLDLLEGGGADHMGSEREALLRNVRDRAQTADPVLSVVMPVYNGAEYLADCIGSILTQTFDRIELIVVNNGSTDTSQTIIDYFAARDPRVVPVFQEEPNQRSARNLGVSMARGKYLHLSDGDDLLVPDAYRQLVETMEEKSPDVLYFFFHEMYNTPKVGEPRYRSYRNYLPQDDFYWMDEAHKPFFAQYPFPWAKIFRKDYFEEKGLQFDLDCANFDDNPQNLRTLLSSDNIAVLNRAFYKFRINEKSMTQSINPRVYGMLDAVRIMNELYAKWGVYDRNQPFYVPYKVHLLHFAFSRLPEDMRQAFFAEIPAMFIRGDEDFFRRDELFSMFPYLDLSKVEFIEAALSGDLAGYEQMIASRKELSSQVRTGARLPREPFAARTSEPGCHSAGVQDHHERRLGAKAVPQPLQCQSESLSTDALPVRGLTARLGGRQAAGALVA